MWTRGEDGQPWLSESALIAAVGASLLLFHVGGAPSTYPLVNAAAPGLALIAMVASGRLRPSTHGAAWVVGLGLSGICVTLLSSVDAEGVRRWIPLGPYPTPLAGYGAAAILGYGLAIAVLRATVQFRVGSG